MILAALNRDLRLPLPTEAVEPTAATNLHDATDQWDIARKEMRRNLDQLQPEAIRHSHPVLGPLSVLQMLALEAAHTAYHGRQIRAILTSPESPD